jgi:hypothetical protein
MDNKPARIPALSRRAALGTALAAVLLPSLTLGQTTSGSAPLEEGTKMKIRIAFADQDFIATLHDNASARELAAMLPLELTIADFSTNEKIAYLPRKLTELVRGPFPDAAPGDLCYYVPWGNLAFFHGAYESTRDLVRLGRLDGGVEPLLTRGEFPLRIELVG